MKYFVVLRNEKKQTENIVEKNSMGEAKKEKEAIERKGHKGEVVIAYGSNLKEMLDTFTEYRPKNWRQLIQGQK